jgi:hypothetical protein
MTTDRPNEQDANWVIEQQLDEKIRRVESAFDADVLTLVSGILFGVEMEIKSALEAKKTKREKLLLVLETYGGYMEVAERIALILRHHYHEVEFLIPNFALSAGTVLVMSGDAIHMDYASILGPIDPQIERPGGSGGLVPALGYLVQFERLIEKDRQRGLTTAELTYLVQNFNAAELYRFEQERELSIALLKEWLVKYKFKNWKKTRGRKKAVTKTMRSRRASEVAKLLNKTDRWGSHSRGIPIEVLRKDLKLEIEDFGAVLERRKAVGEYYRLLKDYMMRRAHQWLVVHTAGLYNGR